MNHIFPFTVNIKKMPYKTQLNFPSHLFWSRIATVYRIAQ